MQALSDTTHQGLNMTLFLNRAEPRPPVLDVVLHVKGKEGGSHCMAEPRASASGLHRIPGGDIRCLTVAARLWITDDRLRQGLQVTACVMRGQSASEMKCSPWWR